MQRLLSRLSPKLALHSAWVSKDCCRCASRSSAASLSANSHQAMKSVQVKIGLCQFKVGRDKALNIETAEKAIKEAVSAGASLVALPEIWNSPYETASFPKYAEDIEGGKSECANFLSASAKAFKITLVGGTIPEKSSGKVYNTCLVYDKNGQLLARHRKVHLFDIDIPGKQTFRESDTLASGDSLTVVDTDCGKLGIGICYDIRFPELAAVCARRGAQMLVYPGAFNTTTGPAHWTLLQRARAVDNQVFVATCSPANNPEASYSAYGHSMVVSPWGEVMAEAGSEPATIVTEVDFSENITRQTNMPLKLQRRDDLYELVDKHK